VVLQDGREAVIQCQRSDQTRSLALKVPGKCLSVLSGSRGLAASEISSLPLMKEVKAKTMADRSCFYVPGPSY